MCVCLVSHECLLCYTEQGYADYPKYDDDDNTMSGDLNDVQHGCNDWLQDYANYLATLNLTSLPYEGASNLTVDTLTGADGRPASPHSR